ncbi:hypothetical protein B6I74_24420 [Klebsiella variicola]|nr:hypothetical protein B6I74_24420 [Klebsiella variicola]
MLNSISYGTQKRHCPRRRAGATLPPGLVIFFLWRVIKNFIFALEKCTADIILYSGQAMLAFMLSF